MKPGIAWLVDYFALTPYKFVQDKINGKVVVL